MAETTNTPARAEWLHEGWLELLASPLAGLASPAAGALLPLRTRSSAYPKVVAFEDQKLGLTLQRALFTGKVPTTSSTLLLQCRFSIM